MLAAMIVVDNTCSANYSWYKKLKFSFYKFSMLYLFLAMPFLKMEMLRHSQQDITESRFHKWKLCWPTINDSMP